MKTRMGTNVSYIHGIDCDGWCDCVLVWEEPPTDRRQIHISDLRTESTIDEEKMRNLTRSMTNQQKNLKA